MSSKQYIFSISIAAILVFGVSIFSAHAQISPTASSSDATTANHDQITTMKAVVLQVTSQDIESTPGISASTTVQTLQVKILNGVEAGKTISVDNDYVALSTGDVFYLVHDVNASDGTDIYSVSDPYRLSWLWGLAALFIIMVLVFGGKQGARGLVALLLSFLFIIYLLFPAILHGFSPVWISMGVAALIIILGSYITHGFNRVTTAAVIGMVSTIIVTGLLALWAIHGAKLTGFANDEAVYLNMNTNGMIDFAGLLLGGILIGALGVLYDAAIGQAVAVDELRAVGPHLPRAVIFKRALRIGREHVGALVNTLAIAYVGASLPLLLLFYQSGADVALTLNKEVFATEIVRILIGSIGLVMAVPLTTFIASVMLVGRKKEDA
jgi:uncharacterized membrane protein